MKDEAHTYDLIVGSDIIYTDLILKPLAESIAFLLKQDAVAYIANNKIRYDYQREKFEQQIESNELKIVDKIDLEDERGTMRLLVIKRE